MKMIQILINWFTTSEQDMRETFFRQLEAQQVHAKIRGV